MNSFSFTNGMIAWSLKNRRILIGLVMALFYPFALILVWSILNMPLYLVVPFCEKAELETLKKNRESIKKIDFQK